MRTPEEFVFQWNPGLENDDETLEEVLRKLPGMAQADVHFLVRFFENPASRFALTGAVDLFNHDCIHIVLGRGLQLQDEAFVIGFTMGTSKGLAFAEYSLFYLASRFLYPKTYRFDRAQFEVWKMAFEFGMKSAVQKIYDIDFRSLLYKKLSEVRNIVRIDKDELYEVYAREKHLLPNTEVSRRLPTKSMEIIHPRRMGAVPSAIAAVT